MTKKRVACICRGSSSLRGGRQQNKLEAAPGAADMAGARPRPAGMTATHRSVSLLAEQSKHDKATG